MSLLLPQPPQALPRYNLKLASTLRGQGETKERGRPLKTQVARSFYKQGSFHIKLGKQPIGEGNGTPLQYFCLENPRDRGAW